MADKWVAECIPCKWEEHYDKQDDAIAAVEQHVHDLHWKVPPHERTQQVMGHVQNRTVGVPFKAGPADESTKSRFPAVSPGDGAANLPPAPDATEAGSDLSTVEEKPDGA